MTIRFQMPIAYAIGSTNSAGNILPGTQLRFYDVGTTTPKTVYSDKELNTSITQPIAADSAGRFPDIYLSGLYKVRWETSAEVEIDTWDYVDPGIGVGSGGGFLAVADGGTGAGTAGGALANLGGASQEGLDDEIAAREALDVRVVTLETASAFVTPGGRLTLTSATPVLTSDVTAATTVYYTPYLHNRVPLWDGSQWTLTEVDEVSQTLADTTKSPAGAAVSSNYDMFVWNDSGTVRCTRGPAWSNATARGTGAGTTELERIDGFYTNKQNITNGPLANTGLYVGTISTNASTQLAMMFAPAAAAGGSANRLDVWNMYNRVDVCSTCRDSTDSWTYTTATWRAANAGAASGVAYRVTLVRGLDEEMVDALHSALSTNSTSATERNTGVGLDATNAIASGSLTGSGNATSTAALLNTRATWTGLAGLGSHFIQALEYSTASGTCTWYGDNGAATVYQAGLVVRTRM